MTEVAAEMQLSGFATLGAAVSDQNFNYQRYLNDSGTFNRDSLIGVQLENKIIGNWNATLQAKAAPSTHDDNAWEPTLSWAFVSWRPNDDWLLRIGKLRLPLLRYSANSDVGVTFDFMRLPTEMYSLLPSVDVKGFSFTKTWSNNAEREWMLESYIGVTHTDWRYFLRESIPPDFTKGALYIGVNMKLIGLTASLHSGNNLWHIGLHRAEVYSDYGALPRNLPFVSIAPGIGYFKINDAMPGPAVPTVDYLIVDVFTFSAEIELPNAFRLIGEYGRRRINNATMGPDTSAAYLSVLKQVGRWTPYVYWSGVRSISSALGLYTAVNQNRVPDFIPDAAFINASQRVEADLQGAFDQYSVAIGTSYQLSPTSKIKAEWLHTRTGSAASFIDAPFAEEGSERQVNVFSLSYSVVF
ncbi:hypothetical protein CKO09_01795 [Chromatium weissei]|nr:hypothetical protein [Chromatium weissei]